MVLVMDMMPVSTSSRPVVMAEPMVVMVATILVMDQMVVMENGLIGGARTVCMQP